MFTPVRVMSLVVLASLVVLSQKSSSMVQGTAQDASGSPVPNVSVTATLASTETSYATVTNADGNCVIPDIRPDGGHGTTTSTNSPSAAVRKAFAERSRAGGN